MKNNFNVSLVFEEDVNDKDFYSEGFEIYLDDTLIGTADGCFDNTYFRISFIEVLEEYRGKGYGTIAMNKLIELAKKIGALFIVGECPRCRVNFYSRVGAKFECRTAFDETFINNVFYIDIGNKDDIEKIIREIDEDEGESYDINNN